LEVWRVLGIGKMVRVMGVLVEGGEGRIRVAWASGLFFAAHCWMVTEDKGKGKGKGKGKAKEERGERREERGERRGRNKRQSFGCWEREGKRGGKKAEKGRRKKEIR